jgi:hypothetical protein
MVAAAVLALLAPATAQASAGLPATQASAAIPAKSFKVVRPMQAIGFDRDVAAANGFEIRVNNQGHEYSVPVGSDASATPSNTVTGNCGSSYVQITPVGNRKALIQTGFTVYTGAVDFDWVVHVIDNYGVSNKTWGSPLAFRSSWVGTNNFTSSGTGYASAEVTYGVAFLWDGTICFALGPFASTYIY